MGVAMKTHDCGTLRPKDAGTAVKLAGWVQRRRDHGGLIFVDLRDRSGVVQVVVNPERVGPEVFPRAERLRSEYVIMVEGEVVRRMPGMENPDSGHRRDRGGGHGARNPQRGGDAPVSHRPPGGRRGKPPIALPLPGLAPAGSPAQPGAPPQGDPGDPLLSRQAGFLRDRDADADPQHPGRGAATTWCPAGSILVLSMPCRNRPSSLNSS